MFVKRLDESYIRMLHTLLVEYKLIYHIFLWNTVRTKETFDTNLPKGLTWCVEKSRTFEWRGTQVPFLTEGVLARAHGLPTPGDELWHGWHDFPIQSGPRTENPRSTTSEIYIYNTLNWEILSHKCLLLALSPTILWRGSRVSVVLSPKVNFVRKPDLRFGHEREIRYLKRYIMYSVRELVKWKSRFFTLHVISFLSYGPDVLKIFILSWSLPVWLCLRYCFISDESSSTNESHSVVLDCKSTEPRPQTHGRKFRIEIFTVN